MDFYVHLQTCLWLYGQMENSDIIIIIVNPNALFMLVHYLVLYLMVSTTLFFVIPIDISLIFAFAPMNGNVAQLFVQPLIPLCFLGQVRFLLMLLDFLE